MRKKYFVKWKINEREKGYWKEYEKWKKMNTRLQLSCLDIWWSTLSYAMTPSFFKQKIRSRTFSVHNFFFAHTQTMKWATSLPPPSSSLLPFSFTSSSSSFSFLPSPFFRHHTIRCSPPYVQKTTSRFSISVTKISFFLLYKSVPSEKQVGSSSPLYLRGKKKEKKRSMT